MEWRAWSRGGLPCGYGFGGFCFAGRRSRRTRGFPVLNDLFFSAEDLYSATGESVAAGSLFGKDAAAPVTGSYVKAVGLAGLGLSAVWTPSGCRQLFAAAGSGFPAGVGHVGGGWQKADVAATQELES